MFRGHRAWFSQSVSPGPRGLWADGGGTIAHWLDADYLFSSDAAHPDTRSIHESLSYLEGKATVFHSCYLSVCASTRAAERPSVLLGHFILPPACLHEEIKRKIGRFIWEKADALEEQASQLLRRKNPKERIFHKRCLRQPRKTLILYCSVHYQGLGKAEPKENPTDEPEAARNSCEEESEEEVLDLAESTEETESEAPTQGEFPCRALQEYPINNMVTGYASARDMKKYEGELHDFIPGTSGYAVYWVQSKCSIYCEKAKMKRKW